MKSSLDVLKQDAPYLDSTRNKWVHIGFLSAFTLVFLTVYSPFNISEWDGSILGYTIVGAVVLIVSQFGIRPILGLQKAKLYQLLLLALAEILIITFGIYVFFGPEFSNFDQKLGEYLLTLKYVCLIIAIPYLLSVWFMASSQKLKAVQHFNTSSTITKKANLLSIKGENKKVNFAIDMDQIVFVKSAGNYLDINYLKGGKPATEIVRMSLRELETKVAGSSLFKVHRSYILNKAYISSFKKNKKGYDLVIHHFADETIPVSAGFKKIFEEVMGLKLTH